MPTSSHALLSAGLSPRLRGSAREWYQVVTPHRVIPAPAGIGQTCMQFLPLYAGYPRACGDRREHAPHRRLGVGLSPRLRGSAGSAKGAAGIQRVIPAPAGIGRRTCPRAWTQAGYPRACGDRLARGRFRARTSGLSPRLRGSVRLGARAGISARVIPAPAGIGPSRAPCRRLPPGYPRACGDRTILWRAEARPPGLSPRLRGSAGQGLLAARAGRVIPAPAGIGAVVRFGRGARAGYPRACGDRPKTVDLECTSAGLSPRLRGSGEDVWHFDRPCRVIPAPAGIGEISIVSVPADAGYPRACGDR